MKLWPNPARNAANKWLFISFTFLFQIFSRVIWYSLEFSTSTLVWVCGCQTLYLRNLLLFACWLSPCCDRFLHRCIHIFFMLTLGVKFVIENVYLRWIVLNVTRFLPTRTWSHLVFRLSDDFSDVAFFFFCSCSVLFFSFFSSELW